MRNLKLQLIERFNELSSGGKTLFYIDIDRDEIWNRYLSGWADDPIEQQGHNCNSCKSFLRQYAGIVTIVDNKVQSIWDITPEKLYAKSIKNVRDYVVSLPITNVFMNSFSRCGTDKNVDGKKPGVVWEHFFIELPSKYVVRDSSSIPSKQGELRDNKNVLKRSLDEILPSAVDSVLELIGQNSIYRGKESEGVLIEFQKLQREYAKVPAGLKDNYAWVTSMKVSQSLSRIRNTAMGTLLIDLSSGMELDNAVSKFEKMVAPTNYKRPVALVTPRMVDDAKAKIEELGYIESLERRFAQDSDLNINDILYIDKTSSLTNVFDEMKDEALVNPRTFSKVEEIGIDAFIENVLPKAKGVYVLLENSHFNNMVTLLTSSKNDAPSLFKWENKFSWAYTGGITDSIKERVKNAGGNVDGELRVSLSWHNYDDLDLHVNEPSGNHIYFSNCKKPSIALSTGQLDVDMNAGSGTTRNGVENIVWTTPSKMEEGVYKVVVHNYSQREKIDQGFEIQIECRGEVFDLGFSSNPKSGEFKNIIEFEYKRSSGLKLKDDVKSNIAVKEKWNLKTNRFHKVKQVLLSPNCWEGINKGNKHHFFILENCASDETTRPFFNEFLKEELTSHRKFFELLGNKLSLAPTTKQLAGLGFSETQRNNVIVRIEGATKRLIKINF